MNLTQVSLFGKALSDPNRLRIVQLLTYGEQCACELLKQMQITQSTLSHHMKTLEDCGLVSSRKQGKWSHYSLNCGRWISFRDFIQDVILEIGAQNDSDRKSGLAL